MVLKSRSPFNSITILFGSIRFSRYMTVCGGSGGGG